MRNHRADLAVIERRQNIAAERLAKARAEGLAVAVGVHETIGLRSERGEIIERPDQKRGERQKPAIVRDGWDMARADFAKKGYRNLVSAGDKYAETYRTAWGSGMKCDCTPTIKATVQNDNDPPDLRARQAIAKLNRDALANIRPFAEIIEQVCGKGTHLLAIAKDKNGIAVLKERLANALALVAVYWGME